MRSFVEDIGVDGTRTTMGVQKPPIAPEFHQWQGLQFEVSAGLAVREATSSSIFRLLPRFKGYHGCNVLRSKADQGS